MTGLPGAGDFEVYAKACREKIAAHGHIVQGVEGGMDTPPLCYTVGLGARDEFGYELAISGLPPETGALVLNHAVNELRARELSPRPGLDLIGVIAGYVGVLRSAHTVGRFGVIRLVTGRSCPVWQVVWPDADHRFPGEPGCTLPSYAQQDLAIPIGGPWSVFQRPWAQPVRPAAGPSHATTTDETRD